MDPILAKAQGGRNALEQIVNKIPGFAGYQDRELRRDADRLQREYLASRLDENKKAINDLALTATRPGGSLDLVNDVEVARKRLDKVANRVRYADRGCAGFFDAMKIDEGVLARVYQFDLDLLGGVEEIRTAAATAASDPGGPKAGLQALTAKINSLDSHLADREAILGGLK